MADLFDRLFPTSPTNDKIAVHYFRAAISDYVAGYTTQNQIITAFGLDTDAQADLTVLCNAVDALTTVTEKMRWLIELHDVMMIAESGLKYSTKSAFKTRMGL